MLLQKGQTVLVANRYGTWDIEAEPAPRKAEGDREWAAIVERLLQAVYPELGIRVEACQAGEPSSAENGWLEAARKRPPDWLILPPPTVGSSPCPSAEESADREKRTAILPEGWEAELRRMIGEARMYAKHVALYAPIELEAGGGAAGAAATSRSSFLAAARAAAKETGCLLIDAQAAIQRVLQRPGRPGKLAGEEAEEAIRLALADAFLQSVGFQWIKTMSG